MNSEVIEKKILEDLELDRMLAYWKFRERSVVALYGSFDVLHPGTFELTLLSTGTSWLLSLNPMRR